MKKMIFGILAVTVLFSSVSCSSGRRNNIDEESTVVSESDVIIPEYNTLGISVDEIVSKMNSSGKYTKTWSADCSTQDLGNGKTSFKTNNLIVGSYWSGIYETSTNNIIDIIISYPCDGNDPANAMLACSAAVPVMQYSFNCDQDTAIHHWMGASTKGISGYDYGDYNLTVSYNSVNEAMETIIIPKNELK